MANHVQTLINKIVADEPDPSAANALQEGLVVQFGEMRTMMQPLFPCFSFRGNTTRYVDLIQGIGVRERSHVELSSKTTTQHLDGSPAYNSNKFDTARKGGHATMDISREQRNPHHFTVGARGALPVDGAGNLWGGSYVHNQGNLVLDLMDNPVPEATGFIRPVFETQFIRLLAAFINTYSLLSIIYQSLSCDNFFFYKEGSNVRPILGYLQVNSFDN